MKQLLGQKCLLAKLSLILLDTNMATSAWWSDTSGVQCEGFQIVSHTMKLSRKNVNEKEKMTEA